MKATWHRLGLLGALLLCLSGCWTTKKHLEPPKRPEEYVLPPDGEDRFREPMTYPADTLNTDRIKQDQKKLDSYQPDVKNHGGGMSAAGANF